MQTKARLNNFFLKIIVGWFCLVGQFNNKSQLLVGFSLANIRKQAIQIF
jgi:hypothetical protein